jgi:N-methylhydantoinase A
LNPSLNGKFSLDVAASEQAIDILAAKIGLSRLETAEGMIRISCEAMAQAVKGVVIARARDPRDFVLASFGGAGPMHACFVAQAMNIPKVIIPAQAGVASAFGATAMNVRHDIEAFHYAPLDTVDVADLNRLFADLEVQARARLASDGIDSSKMTVSRTAQMRYVGQTYEVDTDIPQGTLVQKDIEGIAMAFHQAHKLEFGISSDDFPIAFVALGVTAVGALASPPAFDFASKGDAPAPGSRQMYCNGTWHEAALYDGRKLPAGAEVVGPCIIEYADSIGVIPPGCDGKVDANGNLIINIFN